MTNEMANSGPIIFFDSGIGGLSVMAKARQLLPGTQFVYAADFSGLPYGTKSEAEIATRVPVLLGRLSERYRPALITIACNTASTIALEHVRSALDVPIVGTVPAIKPACAMSRSGVIGVLGTVATIRQPYVDRLAARFGAGKTILRHGAPGLVRAAEAKMRGEAIDATIFAEAMAGLTTQPGGERMDVVVLACTHFPLVRDELAAALGRPAQLIDGAEGIARRIVDLLGPQAQAPARHDSLFVTTGALAELAPYRPALARYGLTQFEAI